VYLFSNPQTRPRYSPKVLHASPRRHDKLQLISTNEPD